MIIEPFGLGTGREGMMDRLDKGPGQIGVSILTVVLTLVLAVGRVGGPDASAIGRVIA